MREFEARMIELEGDATERLAPVSFAGRVSELELETLIAAHPELVGEDLFVLGRQLRDFAEDRDRLDVLAVDQDGELVLLELKVSEDFRVTDLQALAYAAAYAGQPTSLLAETLRHSLAKPELNAPLLERTGLTGDATLDEVKAAITEYLGGDSFEDWKPSEKVRIKIIAPKFPKRVLKAVKWLGEVYGMPVEAIEARLFEDKAGRRHITFDRLLPLPGEDRFDMTVRWSEERQRQENVRRTRRQRVLPLLIGEGEVNDGDTLWLVKSALPPDDRQLYDAESPGFQAEVVARDGAPPKLRWRRDGDDPGEVMSPSLVVHAVCSALSANPPEEEYTTPVASTFTLGKDGPTLEELAIEKELWPE